MKDEEYFEQKLSALIASLRDPTMVSRDVPNRASFRKSNELGFSVDIRFDVVDRTVDIETDRELGKYFRVSRFNAPEDAFDAGFALAHRLLSPHARIRETVASGAPVVWKLQLWERGRWRTGAASRKLFWNYFSVRSHRYFTNDQLSTGLGE